MAVVLKQLRRLAPICSRDFACELSKVLFLYLALMTSSIFCVAVFYAAYTGVELDVSAQIKLVDDMVKIALDLRLVGEVFTGSQAYTTLVARAAGRYDFLS